MQNNVESYFTSFYKKTYLFQFSQDNTYINYVFYIKNKFIMLKHNIFQDANLKDFEVLTEEEIIAIEKENVFWFNLIIDIKNIENIKNEITTEYFTYNKDGMKYTKEFLLKNKGNYVCKNTEANRKIEEFVINR